MQKEIISWFSNIRFYILVMSVVISIGEYWYISSISGSRAEMVYSLVQIYAFTAVTFLYLALLAGPFAKMTRFTWRGKFVHARRAIGVSAFFFAALHFRYAYFDILGGPIGVFKLPFQSFFGVALGQTALLILFLMAVTSFDKVIAKMTFPKWKRLHQCVYLAGLAIFLHVSIMGSHFADKTGIIPLIYYTATAILVGIHLYGLYKKRKFEKPREISPTVLQ